MDFFNLFTPDGVMLEHGVIYTVIALMFLYTFVGICAGFGGGLTTMPLITLMLPVKWQHHFLLLSEQRPPFMPHGYLVKKRTGDRLPFLSASLFLAFR